MPPTPDHLIVLPVAFLLVIASDKIVYAIEWVLL